MGGFLILGLTGKRMLFIIVPFVILFICYLGIKNSSEKGTFQIKVKNLFVALLFIFVLSFLLEITGIFKSINTKFDVFISAGDISNGRFDLWKRSLDIFYEHPLLGVGIKGTTTIMSEATHNVYIQLLSDLGIIGAAIFYWSLFYPFLKLVANTMNKRKLSLENNFAIGMQLLFLLYCMTGNPLYDHKMMMIYAISVGYAYYLIKIDKRKG